MANVLIIMCGFNVCIISMLIFFLLLSECSKGGLPFACSYQPLGSKARDVLLFLNSHSHQKPLALQFEQNAPQHCAPTAFSKLNVIEMCFFCLLNLVVG